MAVAAESGVSVEGSGVGDGLKGAVARSETAVLGELTACSDLTAQSVDSDRKRSSCEDPGRWSIAGRGERASQLVVVAYYSLSIEA